MLPDGTVTTGTYHPTFLYESLWCVGVALLVIWADRRFTLGHGRAFALYVAAYTVGRFWTEYLRIDEAHHMLGLRLNDWTAILLFVGAVAYLVIVGRKHPGREAPDSIDPAARAEAEAASESEPESAATAADGPADLTEPDASAEPADAPEKSGKNSDRPT